MNEQQQQHEVLENWLRDWYQPAFRTACLVLGNRSEAEEAVQEAFLRLWRFQQSIPPGEAARAWLYRVVVNACFSRARSEQRHAQRRADYDGVEELTIVSHGSEETAEERARSASIRLALDALPEQLRIPIVLSYFADLSEKEIAIAIKRRRGTVKSRLHEARRRLALDPRIIELHNPEEVAE